MSLDYKREMALFESEFPPERLEKHTYGRTWWGSEDTMPTYRELWIEAMWQGWLMRAKETKKCS